MTRICRIVSLALAMIMLCGACTSALAVGDGLFSFFKKQEDVTITQEEYDTLQAENNELREKIKSIQQFSKLAEIMEVVEDYYYEEPDKDAMLEYAIWGMLQGLGDNYTFYYNPKNWKQMWEDDEGVYAGVGIQMLANFTENTVTISRVFKDTPAQEAGLKKGDRLVRVDDLTVTAETMQDAANLMRGKEAETVEIEVVRKGENIVFTVGRRVITVNTVEYTLLADQVGLIILYDFAGDCVTSFTAALKELRAQGATALVVDLRDNGGGWVDAAEKIADLFLDKQLLFYAEDRFGNRNENYTKDGKDDIPLIVMINGASASSSEILAGSLRAAGRARLVGTQSYGKGIMQYVIPLSGVNGEDDGMQVTFAQYFMPDGTVVHKVGLTPDVIVEIPEELASEYFELGDMTDPQLKAAWEEAVRLRQEETIGAEAADTETAESVPETADWAVTPEDLKTVAEKL